MFNLIIFLVILVYRGEATNPDNGGTEIGFKFHQLIENRKITLNCDHSNEKPLKEYTVREGEDLRINIKFNYFKYLTCQDNLTNKVYFTYENTIEMNNKVTVKAKALKSMGTHWNCTMLANKDDPQYDLVHYKNGTYAAANCFMKIHVRQTNSPQTILVNNMVLPSIRTSLSEKHFDFIAEYQYADGDMVDVTCANLNESLLTMEYELAGTMSDKSIMKDLSSQKSIGFVTKLHSGHNNSYMICTNTEPNDYTKAMVRFVKRTKFSIITVKINGINIRPAPINDIQKNHYHIEYKYESHQHINVTCEVERTDVKLSVTDDDFVTPRSEVSSYKRTELKTKQIVMDFSLSSPDDRNLVCITEYPNGSNAELVSIRFTAGISYIDQLPLHMKLLSNGPMMQLYSDNKLKIIIYEFDDGETLKLTCGPLRRLQPGPVVYLELKDSVSERCNTNGCNVFKMLRVTGTDNNTEIVCYLKEEGDAANPSGVDIVHREIRVVLRERVEGRPLLDKDVS